MAGNNGSGGGVIANEIPPVIPPPRPRGHGHPHTHNHPAVREIHKNAWLKRQISTEGKKGGHHHPFSNKKGEKFWVVFCVHDDTEALLEFYSEPKMGTIHKPLSAISLNSCLHVSPSIMGQDNEYQFAVTLQTEVVRLVAQNWEQMMEWVESLQGKLREMNILSPKDNLYSKLPETKPPPLPPHMNLALVGSTRDPNSPLPPTPSSMMAAAAAAAGRDHRRHQNQSNGSRDHHFLRYVSTRGASEETSAIITSSSNTVTIPSRVSVNGNSSSAVFHEQREEPSAQMPNTILAQSQYDAVFLGASSTSTLGSSTESNPNEANCHRGDGCYPPPLAPPPEAGRKPQVKVRVNLEVNGQKSGPVPAQRHHHQNQNGSLGTTVVVIGNGDVRIHNNGPSPNNTGESSSSSAMNGGGRNGSSQTSSSSVTVRCSSSPITEQREDGENFEIENQSNRQSWDERNASRTQDLTNIINNGRAKADVMSSSLSDIHDNRNHRHDNELNNATGLSSSSSVINDEKRQEELSKRVPSRTKKSTSSENIYEHIYLPERQLRGKPSNGTKARSHHQTATAAAAAAAATPPERPERIRSPEEHPSSFDSSALETHARRMMMGGGGGVGVNGSSQRSSSAGRVEQQQQQHPHHHHLQSDNRNGHHHPHAVGNSTFFVGGSDGAGNVTELQGNPMDALVGGRAGDYRLRRNNENVANNTNSNTNVFSGRGSGNASATTEPHTLSENDNQQQGNATLIGAAAAAAALTNAQNPQLPLKEQQVMHLQKEINHPGGVRITLRKKDCINSIAFVDYLGAVWVAGWKQTQFPVLYYALHVGDQILKVAGVTVQSSAEASRAIKMSSATQIEFILRRLPYGRVFALKRSRDGEPLGLVAEGGSGEISEVLPEGLAARYGLPPKGYSLDGQTPCNWYLTEVNHRPLSLMSKENEVKDRLNAVGKEISILVQPADLVKHLRKSLKSYKGFKDYVVG